MLAHLRSNAVAYLALFVSLGGTSAYAFNEWSGDNIIDESLTGADILGSSGGQKAPAADGSLTGFDVQDGSIGNRDLARTAGGIRTVEIQREFVELSRHQERTIRVRCRSGFKALGGGYSMSEGALRNNQAQDLAVGVAEPQPDAYELHAKHVGGFQAPRFTLRVRVV